MCWCCGAWGKCGCGQDQNSASGQKVTCSMSKAYNLWTAGSVPCLAK